jgi:hypothetical protein
VHTFILPHTPEYWRPLFHTPIGHQIGGKTLDERDHVFGDETIFGIGHRRVAGGEVQPSAEHDDP